MVEGMLVLSFVLFSGASGGGATIAPAYVDPGSGSLIIQAVAAGLVGAALTFRRIREGIADALRAGIGRLSSLFRREDPRS
jgi:hypothetical protein